MPLVPRAILREEGARLIQRMISHRPFRRMMERQGIDLTGSWWRLIEHKIFAAMGRCPLCTNAHICRSWLDSDGPSAEYVRFCPNAEIIETCRILSPGVARPEREAGDPSG